MSYVMSGKKYDAMRARAEKAEADLAALHADLRAKDRMAGHDLNTADILREQLAAARAEIETHWRVRCDQLAAHRDRAERDLAAARADFDALRSANGRLAEETMMTRELNGKLMTDLERVRALWAQREKQHDERAVSITDSWVKEALALRDKLAAARAEIERLTQRCEELDDEKAYAEERNAAQWNAGRDAGIQTASRPLRDFQARAEKAEARAEKAEADLAAQAAAATRLAESMGTNEPWPVDDVLDHLATAVTHLLDDHDCDHHGWEAEQGCVGRARSLAARIRAARTGTPDPGKEGA